MPSIAKSALNNSLANSNRQKWAKCPYFKPNQSKFVSKFHPSEVDKCHGITASSCQKWEKCLWVSRQRPKHPNSLANKQGTLLYTFMANSISTLQICKRKLFKIHFTNRHSNLTLERASSNWRCSKTLLSPFQNFWDFYLPIEFTYKWSNFFLISQ